MATSVKHSAKSSFQGVIYQYFVALEKCFEMKSGDFVRFEEDGDVSTVNEQIEVKHVEDDLTDRNLNFWKTLNNWLDPAFERSKYQSLVLLTTQKIGSNSLLNNWNNKSHSQKLTILKNIKKTALDEHKNSGNTKKTEVLNYIEKCLSTSNKIIFNEIIQKFILLDQSEISVEFYNSTRDRYLKAVKPLRYKDQIMQGLLGYILSRHKVNSVWEISYNDFSNEFSEFVAQFSENTKTFPEINYSYSQKEIDENLDHLFVQKINEINYTDQISKAVSDYLSTQKIILEEISDHTVAVQHYFAFENELQQKYHPKYSQFSRKANPNSFDESCQDFYDEMMGMDAPKLGKYDHTPIIFKNGVLHILANENNITWKLKSNE